jgi:hypothetical protein
MGKIQLLPPACGSCSRGLQAGSSCAGRDLRTDRSEGWALPTKLIIRNETPRQHGVESHYLIMNYAWPARLRRAYVFRVAAERRVGTAHHEGKVDDMPENASAVVPQASSLRLVARRRRAGREPLPFVPQARCLRYSRCSLLCASRAFVDPGRRRQRTRPIHGRGPLNVPGTITGRHVVVATYVTARSWPPSADKNVPGTFTV